MEKKAENKRNKAAKRITLLVLILLLLGGTFASAGYIRRSKPQDRFQQEFEVKYGMLPNKTPEEIRALLDKTMSEGMVNIVVNSTPRFDKKTMRGNINIENIAANQFCQQVDIVLQDTGEVLASSGLIHPGQYVDYVTLNKTLEEGEYPAVAVFKTCYPDGENEILAVNNFELTLTVQ